jgi:hypothetical protein
MFNWYNFTASSKDDKIKLNGFDNVFNDFVIFLSLKS